MRIAFALLAAGLMAGTPVMAREVLPSSKDIESLSARLMKSGVMTVNGKSFPVFLVQGGDIVADVVPSKPGQPTHLAPTHHEFLRLDVDANGVIALNSAVDALLSGQPADFDATIQYNGRKLTLSGASLKSLQLPSCSNGKAGRDVATLDISAVKIKIVAEAEPAQVKPEKITGCNVTLEGFAPGSIHSVIPGPNFRSAAKETGVGEMRDYEEDAERPKIGDIILRETAVVAWARNDIEKGIGESRNLQIVYATAAGPTVRVSYGRTLVRRVPLDLNASVRVTLATEAPSITKP